MGDAAGGSEMNDTDSDHKNVCGLRGHTKEMQKWKGKNTPTTPSRVPTRALNEAQSSLRGLRHHRLW